MNKLAKRSFYSFLALYLTSSFVFLSLAAYWFYTSQVSMEMQRNFYKMNHIADLVSARVISAAMQHKPFRLQKFDKAAVALLDSSKRVQAGMLVQDITFEKDFYISDGIFTLISKRTTGHLGIEYVVVQSDECVANVAKIKNKIAYAVVVTAVLIIFIAVVLSYIFLKPIKEKMQEIEDFVKDTSHELNTPITALMMSVSRLKNKEKCDEKTLKNISISTKQLYDIYASLSFVSFDTKEPKEDIDLAKIITEQIEYTAELLERKNITLTTKLQACTLHIAPTKAKMIVSNILGNAIKYSHQSSRISITLSQEKLTIEDEGIGIAKEKLHLIFKRFVRASDYGGGFGVGLSIVKQIIDEYGYTIEIDSQEHQGTKVSVVFR